MSLSMLLKTAGFVFVAMTLIVFGDTAGKLLMSGGVNPIFVAWSRFAIGALILLPLSGLKWAELRHFADWRIILRALFIVGGICCILTALRTEPIANVFGAFFIGPVVSYVLAVIFLDEKITGLRTGLLLMGFAGVMLVVKPGFGATQGILYALLAGCSYGAYLAITRATAGQYRPRLLLVSQLMIGAAVLTPVGFAVEWPDFAMPTVLLLVISAVASAGGNFILVLTNRIASATLIAPLIYTQLISATVVGVVVFGDWPDTLALLGLVVIALSGFGSQLAIRMGPKA